MGGAAPQGRLVPAPAAVMVHNGCHIAENQANVYVIQVEKIKTVGRDHTQLLPREPDPHRRAVIFEFTADAIASEDDREEDEYTTKRILSDKPDTSTQGGRLYKVRWKGFAASRDLWEPPSSFVPGYTSVWVD